MKRAFWTAGVCAGLLVAVGGSAFFRSNRTETKVAPKPAAVVPTEPVVEPAPARATQERDLLLETIGSLTSAHYFQTYLNIGFVADGKANGTYTEKDARRVLDSIVSLVNSLDRKLEGLDKIELSKDDRDRLEQLRAVSALLRQQGKELQLFWETGKAENADKYEALRKTAWATISKLMGIGQ
jgi:hypothetical protein